MKPESDSVLFVNRYALRTRKLAVGSKQRRVSEKFFADLDCVLMTKTGDLQKGHWLLNKQCGKHPWKL